MTHILPITYFGNLEYYWYLAQEQSTPIHIGELYQKQTFRNRCSIMSANGPLNLSVPVKRPFGKQTTTKDVLISNAENWRQVHWKTFESCYNRTPYFEFYADQIKALLFAQHEKLVNLNMSLTNHLIDKIGLIRNLSIVNTLDDIPMPHQKIVFSPKVNAHFKGHSYLQTFSERYGYVDNLSILDLLFNEGPNTICILNESSLKNEEK